MLVDKCHLADIHKPTRRLKLTDDDSKFCDDALQALAWIADRMEAGCIIVFDEKIDRALRVNPADNTFAAFCVTSNIGNYTGEHSLLRGMVHLLGLSAAFTMHDLDNLLVELEYGNTAPFSKYLIQK